jgi:hypothetical protein
MRAMMKVEATKQHEWLRQLVGEWTFEHESPAGPDQPPQKFTGTDSVRMLGDVWAICEGSGPMPEGGTAHTIMTLGYDPQKQQFVGTFIGSMMTNLWIYENGQLDEAGRALSLHAEGPSFSPEGGMAKYIDTIEFVSPDERLLRSQIQQPDGTWVEFMKATYRRVQ